MKRLKWLVSAGLLCSSFLLQAGSLHVDKAIELLAVDGKVLKSLNTTPRDLKSGDHQLVFRYKSRLRDGRGEVEFKPVEQKDTLLNRIFNRMKSIKVGMLIIWN